MRMTRSSVGSWKNILGIGRSYTRENIKQNMGYARLGCACKVSFEYMNLGSKRYHKHLIKHIFSKMLECLTGMECLGSALASKSRNCGVTLQLSYITDPKKIAWDTEKQGQRTAGSKRMWANMKDSPDLRWRDMDNFFEEHIKRTTGSSERKKILWDSGNLT